MFSFNLCFYLWLLLHLHTSLADVSIQTPEQGSSYSPGSDGTISIDLEWVDDTASPTLDQITYYTFTLCTGPNDEIVNVKTLASQITASQLTIDSSGDDKKYGYTLSIPKAVTGNGQYYIQVFAWLDNEGSTIHYTPRFTLQKMTGATSYTYTDATQPAPQTSIHYNDNANNNGGDNGGTIDTRSFTVPYTKQSGISRFAPMQMQPGTKITRTCLLYTSRCV